MAALVFFMLLPLGKDQGSPSSQEPTSSWQGTTVSIGDAGSAVPQPEGSQTQWEPGSLQTIDPSIRSALENSNPLDQAYQEHLNAGESKAQLNESFMGYWRMRSTTPSRWLWAPAMSNKAYCCKMPRMLGPSKTTSNKHYTIICLPSVIRMGRSGKRRMTNTVWTIIGIER